MAFSEKCQNFVYLETTHVLANVATIENYSLDRRWIDAGFLQPRYILDEFAIELIKILAEVFSEVGHAAFGLCGL